MLIDSRKLRVFGINLGCALHWLRWWDDTGNLLLAGDELAKREALRAEREALRAERESLRAELAFERVTEEKRRTEQERQRAEHEKQRADRLAAKLRELGIDAEDA